MKKLFMEYFYIPQNGKVREKVMLARVAVSILFILGCMAAMSITAYAFFSHSVSSGQMTVESKYYDLTVTPPEGIITQENDVYTLYNDTDEDKEFAFSIAKAQGENVVAVGYCKISVKTDANSPDITEDVQNFYTKPIGTYIDNDVKVTNDLRWVKITVEPHKTAIVRFIAEWGTCAKEPIIDEIITPDYGSSPSVSAGETVKNNTESETQQPEIDGAENQDPVNSTEPTAGTVTESTDETLQDTAEDTQEPIEENTEAQEPQTEG